MEFTTHFGLHSQTTRLVRKHLVEQLEPRADGVLTLSDAPFQGTWAPAATEGASLDYNSSAKRRFSSWALPGSLAVTRGILVSFFSSAY